MTYRHDAITLRIGLNAEASRILRRQELRARQRARYFRIVAKEAQPTNDFPSIKGQAQMSVIAAEVQNARLHKERTVSVRNDQRHALLAYGFLRGVDYNVIEKGCYEAPRWPEVERLANDYRGGLSEQQIKQRFAEWLDKAVVKPPERGVVRYQTTRKPTASEIEAMRHGRITAAEHIVKAGIKFYSAKRVFASQRWLDRIRNRSSAA